LFPLLSPNSAARPSFEKTMDGAAPVFFFPCTLVRTWGTRPGVEGYLCRKPQLQKESRVLLQVVELNMEVDLCGSLRAEKPQVPHISLVFREMWDTTALYVQLSTRRVR
jgi:hypothetical protein